MLKNRHTTSYLLTATTNEAYISHNPQVPSSGHAATHPGHTTPPRLSALAPRRVAAADGTDAADGDGVRADGVSVRLEADHHCAGAGVSCSFINGTE